MWKEWIKPLVRPLPQWATVAVAAPQRLVTATLHWDGQTADVTADHTVASLYPLVIATSVDGGQRPVLEYRDRATGKRLGSLHLAQTTSITIEQTTLTLYRVASGKHRCLPWPRRSWNAWLQNRQMEKNRPSNHFNMDKAGVQQLMIDYLCPRPVVLVSIAAQGHQNIFPMDLIGPLERSGFFSLALRSTNVSVPVMRDVRRVALSSVPATMKADVYKLSAQHKQALQGWDATSIPVRPSKEFGVPVVAAALRIQELAIVHSQEVGLHTFFLGRIASDEKLADGTQLHHTAGFHQAWRRRQRVPLTEI
ncbi:flavin reductase [Rhodanobacter sp. L36]|uniref:flavin reductase n=1 Tax=Rhodanobacter sp. L36 TaxID=1747221 RepID=UPI00131D7E27|nr:flavin reductase [Rhodanobacter sp. L36]